MKTTAAGGQQSFSPAVGVVFLLGALACAPSSHLPKQSIVVVPPAAAASPAAQAPSSSPASASAAVADRDDPFLVDLERRTFRYFWETTDPTTGLVPDRWPAKTFSSIAAIGFGLTSYGVGAERGWVTREEAAERVAVTLRILERLPQGDRATGMSGYHGFFYHFLSFEDGSRYRDVELSSIDTALLFAGVLFVQGYFDREVPLEIEIRHLAEELFARVDWTWMQTRPPLVAMGWYPEKGFHHLDWTGYSEAMLLYILALGSPTHPVEPEAWTKWTSTYEAIDFYGQHYLDFGPLFGHQYTHVWVDFRGIHDAANARLGFDYFESSRRATLAQQAWAAANPRGWKGIDAAVWGVSASDGPADIHHEVNGETRAFWSYAGRGIGPRRDVEDGTITPTAAGGSMAFAPEIALPALVEMARRHGDELYTRYGFLDAFNPTFDFPEIAVHDGHVVPGAGWYDSDYLGIDQGPILLMIENYRSGLIWKVMRDHPVIRRGLTRAGFSGEWLDEKH